MSPGALGIHRHPSRVAGRRSLAGGYVSQGRLRRLSTVLLAFVLITLATIASDLVDLTVWIEAERARAIAEADAEMMALRRLLTRSLHALAFVGCATVLGRFLVQANRNAACLGAGLPSLAPSSMVLWFFVPLACLWRPYLAVRELWQMSTPRAGDREGVQGSLPLWWATWVSGLALMVVALQRAHVADSAAEHGEVIVVELAAELALVLAAVFTASWTRALSQRQDDARTAHVCALAVLR
jgi:uncharacterized protein DUF4328